MGRLTEDEKMANKRALSEKRRAHTARRNLCAAREVELTAERVGPLQQAGERASVASDLGFRKIRDYDLACREEIERLCRKHAEERAPLEAAQIELRRAEGIAWDLRNQAINDVRKQVEAEFPDLKGNARYSVAAWTPPD